MKNVILLVFLSLAASGCASLGQRWKELISDSSASSAQPEGALAAPKQLTFSEQSQLLPSQERQYRRVTRKNFDDGSQLHAKSGSLWVMEGQGAYLFAENTVRMIGDPVVVRIEGDPKDQLTAKADVIAGLIKQLEERRKRALNRASQNEKGKKEGATDAAASNEKAGQDSPAGNLADGAGAARTPASADGDSTNYNVKMVPTRVVERLVDGNYRVRGTQSFMIGGREYKTIVSGIVRAEDFNEQGVSAGQLLDSSFDIVSAKGAEMRQ